MQQMERRQLKLKGSGDGGAVVVVGVNDFSRPELPRVCPRSSLFFKARKTLQSCNF